MNIVEANFGSIREGRNGFGNSRYQQIRIERDFHSFTSRSPDPEKWIADELVMEGLSQRHHPGGILVDVVYMALTDFFDALFHSHG
jgi:hypothetical protein